MGLWLWGINLSIDWVCILLSCIFGCVSIGTIGSTTITWLLLTYYSYLERLPLPSHTVVSLVAQQFWTLFPLRIHRHNHQPTITTVDSSCLTQNGDIHTTRVYIAAVVVTSPHQHHQKQYWEGIDGGSGKQQPHVRGWNDWWWYYMVRHRGLI